MEMDIVLDISGHRQSSRTMPDYKENKIINFIYTRTMQLIKVFDWPMKTEPNNELNCVENVDKYNRKQQQSRAKPQLIEVIDSE